MGNLLFLCNCLLNSHSENKDSLGLKTMTFLNGFFFKYKCGFLSFWGAVLGPHC